MPRQFRRQYAAVKYWHCYCHRVTEAATGERSAAAEGRGGVPGAGGRGRRLRPARAAAHDVGAPGVRERDARQQQERRDQTKRRKDGRRQLVAEAGARLQPWKDKHRAQPGRRGQLRQQGDSSRASNYYFFCTSYVLCLFISSGGSRFMVGCRTSERA